MVTDLYDWNPEILQLRSENLSKEIVRLFKLQNLWLAEALLKLVRDIRNRFPEKLGHNSSDGFNKKLVWQIVPEVAKRLGSTRLQSGEANDESVIKMDEHQLKICAGLCLVYGQISSFAFDFPGSKPPSEEILGNAIEDGNPLMFALDRLIPNDPKNRKQDWIQKHLKHIAKTRGLGSVSLWYPGFIQSEQKIDSINQLNELNFSQTNLTFLYKVA